MASSMGKRVLVWPIALAFAITCGIAAIQPAGMALADDGSFTAVDVPTQENPVDPVDPMVHADGWEKDAAGWHYWKNNAKVVSQWVNEEGVPTGITGGKAGAHRYWIGADGNLAIKRVIDPKKPNDAAAGGCYYANEFGYPAVGKKIVGKNVYLAKPDGRLAVGNKYGILKTSSFDKTKRIYYINPKTHCATVSKKPVKVKGFGYVLPCNKGGYLAIGRKVMGKKIYLARTNGKLETGNKLGFLSTKRYDKKNKSRLYFIDKKTHAITYGMPVKVSKKFGYVYAPNKQGYLLRACKKIDSKHILLVEKNGRIVNKAGWLTTSKFAGSEQKYRIERTTKNKKLRGARIGKFKVRGRTFFGQSNGTILRNTWVQWGSKIYRVAHSGSIFVDGNCTRMLGRAQGYWSPTRYLIMVDIDNPRCIVFEGWQGGWKMKFVWDCCTGAPSTPTITGTFSLGAKGYSFGEGNGYSCYYWSQISGDYLFHSQLYWPYTWDIQAPAMGSRVSHGCVRLYADNAYWIWTQAPSGTTVACIY